MEKQNFILLLFNEDYVNEFKCNQNYKIMFQSEDDSHTSKTVRCILTSPSLLPKVGLNMKKLFKDVSTLSCMMNLTHFSSDWQSRPSTECDSDQSRRLTPLVSNEDRINIIT